MKMIFPKLVHSTLPNLVCRGAAQPFEREEQYHYDF